MKEQLCKLIDRYVIYGVTILLGTAVMLIIKPVLTPCCTAMVMAYLLDPLVNKLQKLRLSRQFSVFIILLFSACIIGTFFIIFIPTAYSQLLSLTKFLIEKIPLIQKDSITSFLQKYNIIDYEEITKSHKIP
ncbi:MAG: AI-2E family transporter [Ehrlichia sp.]